MSNRAWRRHLRASTTESKPIRGCDWWIEFRDGTHVGDLRLSEALRVATTEIKAGRAVRIYRKRG